LSYQIYHLVTDVNKYVSDTENRFRDEIDQLKKMTIYGGSITERNQPSILIDEDQQDTNTDKQ
ncbi:hypothetical protein ACHHRT_13515, partial [Desulfurivibrio sp. D14AmB]|uniref:hypothetical protein n=1 Tax=Desulfurivibrio sp. D14AmB TaxID=3374370 RepID=UPI00376F41E2